MTNAILRLPIVMAKVGLARSSIYARISAGEFPKPINLGPRSVGWLEAEIDQWIEDRVAQSRPDSAADTSK